MRDLIFGLVGGTALLMFGIRMMGEALEKFSTPMLKRILSALTGNVFKATLVGVMLTALVQSSTAVTVLSVGFVNAGLLKFTQAIGIIYGANIGTTVTAQLMALSFRFKLTDIAMPIIGVGFAITYFARKEGAKNIGNAMMGFGLLFLGLKTLNSGAPFMQNSETIRFFFSNYASIPAVGILLGVVVTAMVHSSSATVALVMVLGATGIIDFHTAIYLTLGDNIGTCITAQLASLQGNIYARRTAWAHTLYNVIGVALLMFFVPQAAIVVEKITALYVSNAGLDVLIANFHTIFNVASTLVFLPITKYFVSFLEWAVKPQDEWEEADDSSVLDKLLLNTPVAAVKASKEAIRRAVERSKTMLELTMNAIYTGDLSGVSVVDESEVQLNALQRNLTRYVVQLSKGNLTGIQASVIPALITCINHVERTGDHVKDLEKLAQVKEERRLPFSDIALKDMKDLQDLVMEMYELLVQILAGGPNSQDEYKRLLRLEDTVDIKAKELVDGHVERLEKEACSVEAGVYFMDIVNFLERISDHIYKAGRDLRNGELGIREERQHL